MKTLETVLKAVLPAPARKWASRKRQHAKLALYRDRPVIHAKNLMRLKELDIERLLSPNETWERDNADILRVYGGGEILSGVNPGDRRAIYHMVRALRPKRVLETGTHVGASAMHIAMALKANGSGSVTTVDIHDVNDGENAPWRHSSLSGSPRDLSRRLGCEIDFVAEPAQRYMQRSTGNYDFIFLDGDHTPLGVYHEVVNALRLLAPGGLILMHDYQVNATALSPGHDIIEGPFLAMGRVSSENPKVLCVPLRTLPWPAKNGYFTSLAVVVSQ